MYRARLPVFLALCTAGMTLAAQDFHSAFSADRANAWIQDLLQNRAVSVPVGETKEFGIRLNEDGSAVVAVSGGSFSGVREIQYVFSRCSLDDRALHTLQKRALNTLQLRFPDLFAPGISWSLVEQTQCKNERDRKRYFHGIVLSGSSAKPRVLAVLDSYLRADEVKARPWQTPEEQIDYMLKMSSVFDGSGAGTQTTDHCIQRIRNLVKNEPSVKNPLPGGTGGGSGGVSEFGEGDPCASALVGCGNCHLPRRNNCTYSVEYLSGSSKRVFQRQVEKNDANGISMISETGRMSIAKSDIRKTTWLSGADPVETWWDFKAFSARGELAHKMLALSQKAKVACTNCHEGHGDFRLTQEGKVFLHKGVVVRRK